MKISPDLIKYIVMFVLIGAGGGGGYYWTFTELQTVEAELEQVTSKLNSHQAKFTPTQSNLNLITQNREATQKLLDGILPVFSSTDAVFAAVRQPSADNKKWVGKDPNDWKRELDAKVIALNDLARQNNVAVPGTYYYTFGAYKTLNPSAEQTYTLGIQLLMVDQIARIVFDTRVKRLIAIRRLAVEAAPKSAESPISLAGTLLQGPNSLYSLHSFEIEVEARPEAVSQIINKLYETPFYTLLRDVEIVNEVESLPSKPEVANRLKESGSKALFDFISGKENVSARIRFDVVVWNSTPETAPKPSTETPSS